MSWKTIRTGQVWRWKGDGERLRHVVVSTGGGRVYSFSEFSAGAHGGYSWAGRVGQFLERFEFVSER